jgi:hypothetical protein
MLIEIVTTVLQSVTGNICGGGGGGVYLCICYWLFFQFLKQISVTNSKN